ncbi:hypothetical protein L596_029702 [Steinernema carpocapsae]|uniref:Uncharacterized protein n=1 Tax=Steinernema carpocapsae TaxID=34508 RepID=A0A4U5LQI4_STECR|nr:hypothetical protein L596_029702 [Steinernema carpocapsae]
MQQRIQMPQPSPGPVMYAAPSMDMNGYAAVYSYQAAFQQPPPQQFIQAEQAYQNSSQFNMPPPGMYSAAQAAQAYQQRPPPQQQQTFYAALPHPSMMQHQEQQRNPFMAPGKHCLSVFDTPAESSAAYTASWVSSTSSIPPEQKASPDQESNPPTPSEYSNNWHEDMALKERTTSTERRRWSTNLPPAPQPRVGSLLRSGTTPSTHNSHHSTSHTQISRPRSTAKARCRAASTVRVRSTLRRCIRTKESRCTIRWRLLRWVKPAT